MLAIFKPFGNVAVDGLVQLTGAPLAAVTWQTSTSAQPASGVLEYAIPDSIVEVPWAP